MSNQIFANSSTVYPFLQSSGGSGDVNGPTSSSNLSLAIFSGITGKIIENTNTELKDNVLKINGTALSHVCELEVDVLSMSDFPTPIAGVITLEKNITYILKKTLTTSDRIEIIEGSRNTIMSCVFGSDVHFNYTGGGTFITSSTNSNIFISNLHFAGNGIFIQSTGIGTFLSITYCEFSGWNSWGLVSGANLFGLNRVLFKDVSGVELNDISEITFDTSKFTKLSGTTTLLKISGLSIGSIRSMIFDVNSTTNMFDIDNTMTGFIKISNSTNSSGLGNFFKAGSKDQSFPRLQIFGNDFTPNSRTIGSAFSQGEITTLSLVQNVYVDMNFLTQPMVLASNNERFELTNSTTGELKYIGLREFRGIVTISIFAISFGGQANEMEFKLLKNGVDLSDGIVGSLDIGNTANSGIIIIPIILAENDLIRLQVQNIQNNDDIIVKNIVISIQ